MSFPSALKSRLVLLAAFLGAALSRGQAAAVLPQSPCRCLPVLPAGKPICRPYLVFSLHGFGGRDSSQPHEALVSGWRPDEQGLEGHVDVISPPFVMTTEQTAFYICQWSCFSPPEHILKRKKDLLGPTTNLLVLQSLRAFGGSSNHTQPNCSHSFLCKILQRYKALGCSSNHTQHTSSHSFLCKNLQIYTAFGGSSPPHLRLVTEQGLYRTA